MSTINGFGTIDDLDASSPAAVAGAPRRHLDDGVLDRRRSGAVPDRLATAMPAADHDVPRGRLTETLSSGRRVVLLVAPPGFGKTTAVRHWLDQHDGATSWLALDLLETNDELFWRHLLGAIRSVISIDDSPGRLLTQRGPDDPLFLDVLVEQIVGQRSTATVILDDISRIGSRSVLAGVALLVARTGHVLKWILTGRSDPALPLVKWRSAGWLVEIREDDLRLRPDEAIAIARAVGAVPWTDDTVSALNRRVDGWPIAVRLALLSIRGPSEVAASTRPDQLLADYLVTEVLDRMTNEERDVALVLSVVDWFDAGLCRELVGSHAPGVVTELRRRQMFISDADGHAGAWRFHPLFRELLAQELRWSEPSRYEASQRRAAAIHRQRGELNAAHRRLTAIGDIGAARELFLEPALQLVSTGDRAGIARLLATAPGPTEVDEATLALDVAMVWMFVGRLATAATWCERAAALPAGPTVVAQLHTTRALLSMLDGDLAAASDHLVALEAAELRDGLGPLDPRLALSAWAAALATGRREDAHRRRENARAIAGPHHVVEVTIPALEAWVALADGELREASRLAWDAWSRAEQGRLSRHRGAVDALVVSAWCHLGCGDMRAARRMAALAHADRNGFDNPWDRVRVGVLGAEAARLDDDPAIALDLLREVRRSVDLSSRPALAEEVARAEAAILISIGRAAAAGELLAPLPDSTSRRLLDARLAVLERRPADVDSAVAERARWSRPQRLEAELLRVAHRQASRGLVTAVVREGAESGWVSPFLGHGEHVQAVLRDAPVERVHPLLAASLRSVGQAGPERRIRPAEPLTARELTIIELLPTHLSYAEIGKRLFVSVNTVKSNLRSIYRKLDVGSRTEAVEASRGLQLRPDRP